MFPQNFRRKRGILSCLTENDALVFFTTSPASRAPRSKKNLRLRPGHIQPQQGIPAVQLGESRDVGTSQDRQTGIIPPAGADGMELLQLPKPNHIYNYIYILYPYIGWGQSFESSKLFVNLFSRGLFWISETSLLFVPRGPVRPFFHIPPWPR